MPYRSMVTTLLTIGMFSLSSFGEAYVWDHSVLSQSVSPDTLSREWSRTEVNGIPLFRPVHITATPWGEVWVNDTGDKKIYRWTTSGGPLDPIGGEGAGPGEFQRPSNLRVWGVDSVSVWDRQLQRLTFFDRTGEVTSTRVLGLTVGAHGFLVNLDARGDTMLVHTYNYPNRNPRPLEDRAVLWRFGPSGSSPDSILTLPAPGMVIDRIGKTATRFPAPFSPRPFIFFLPDGRCLIGYAGEPHFTLLDENFAVLEKFSLDLPVIEVAEGEREAFRDSTLAALASGLARSGASQLQQREVSRSHRRLLDQVEYPLQHPFYLNALVEDGVLWLQLPTRPDSVHLVWRGYSLETKELLREALIPIEGMVFNATRAGDAFFVTLIDERNQPEVVKYRE